MYTKFDVVFGHEAASQLKSLGLTNPDLRILESFPPENLSYAFEPDVLALAECLCDKVVFDPRGTLPIALAMLTAEYWVESCGRLRGYEIRGYHLHGAPTVIVSTRSPRSLRHQVPPGGEEAPRLLSPATIEARPELIDGEVLAVDAPLTLAVKARAYACTEVADGGCVRLAQALQNEHMRMIEGGLLHPDLYLPQIDIDPSGHITYIVRALDGELPGLDHTKRLSSGQQIAMVIQAAGEPLTRRELDSHRIHTKETGIMLDALLRESEADSELDVESVSKLLALKYATLCNVRTYPDPFLVEPQNRTNTAVLVHAIYRAGAHPSRLSRRLVEHLAWVDPTGFGVLLTLSQDEADELPFRTTLEDLLDRAPEPGIDFYVDLSRAIVESRLLRNDYFTAVAFGYWLARNLARFSTPPGSPEASGYAERLDQIWGPKSQSFEISKLRAYVEAIVACSTGPAPASDEQLWALLFLGEDAKSDPSGIVPRPTES